MTNHEKDIQRYLHGEMTPAEQHAFEKAALSDPFLAEALEGLSSLAPAELEADLIDITLDIESQTEHTWQVPAAAAPAKKAVASFDTREMAASAPAPANKPATSWAWPLRIAALLVLLIGGYLFVPLLFEQKKSDLALQEETEASGQTDEPLAALPDTVHNAEPPKQDEQQAKPVTGSKTKQTDKPTLAQADKDSADHTHARVQSELAETEKLARVAETPVAVQQPDEELKESINLKKEARPDVRSALVASAKVIQGRVVAEEDGTPLPGVNIVVKGTTTGAVTDINGHYQLVSNLTSPILVYSFIGLQTEEVIVKDAGEVNVEMKTDVSQLSEVVITGYSPHGADPNREPVIKLAQPTGGLRAYDKYLKNSLRYPQQALENNVKGRVTVSFTVSTDGTVHEFNVMRGLGFGCDEEVIRLVKDGPKWLPTTQDGEPVESEVRVRVKFAPPSR
ncbi:MAG: TonB family protein [Cyclobacteriaceae bacterium]|nr:TonB family protein [Cyclobacteriaceae bacterium]